MAASAVLAMDRARAPRDVRRLGVHGRHRPRADAACNVEEVETANEQQLHEILAELTNTTYFRLFPVDLSRKCKFWNKQKVRDEPDRRRAIACRD